MPKLVNFKDRTVQESEWAIGRIQRRFDGGVWNDGPAKNVPDNGLYYLTNGIAFENEISGRTGNKLFSAQLPTVTTGIVAEKTGYVISVINSLYVWASADIGRFFVWPDGANERITAVTDLGNNYYNLTVDSSVTHATTVLGKLRSNVRLLEWHDTQRKWILQIGALLYTAPWNMSAWTLVCQRSTTALSDSMSQCKMLDRNAVIWNSAGIFLLVLDLPTAELWKVNANVPSVRAADTASNTYCRQVITTFLNLKGDGFLRDRTVKGCAILHETGGNKEDSNLIDYSKIYTASAISAAAAVSYTLDPTSHSKHHTHYGIYCTKDTGTNGTDPSLGAGNNTERYFWNRDIPFIKTFIASRTNADTIISAASFQVFKSYDIASTVKYWNPLKGGGAGFTEETIATVAQYNQITAVLTTALANVPATIGGTYVLAASKSGTTVTTRYYTGAAWANETSAGAHGSSFANVAVGDVLFWSDGTYDIVKSVTSNLVIEVWNSGTKANLAVGWTPIARKYYDTTSDDDLEDRTGFLLKQRALEPLPNANTGDLTSESIWCGQVGDSKVYYGSISEAYLIGYYHPGHQVKSLQHALFGLSAFPNVVIAYGPKEYSECDLASSKILNDDTTYESKATRIGDSPITIYTSWRTVIGRGILDVTAYRKTKWGFDIVVTNERGICIHDGYKFGDDLVANRISKKMRKLQAASALHYDEISGLILWGTETEPLS